MFPSLENSLGGAIDAKNKQDRFVSINDDYTLGVNENIVHVTGFAAAVAVTLPPVGECAGRIFAIKVLDDASVNNVTIQDQDDSRGWTDEVVSAAGGGYVLIWCDGETFFILAN